MKQVKFLAVEFCLSIITGSIFLPLASRQVMYDCSPHCWNPMTQVQIIQNGILQSSVPSEENCKALCANNGTCIGVYWSMSSNECWFQMPATYTGQTVTTGANYWSLTDCTDDCLPYCWRPVLNNTHVSGSTYQAAAADENTCKLLCSNDTCCLGSDWNDAPSNHGCWFAYGSNTQTYTQTNIRHWVIIRNLPTVCQTASTTTTSTTTSKTSSTGTPGNSSSTADSSPSTCTTFGLNTAVIVLALFLGVSFLLNIGMIIAFCIKGKRKPEQPKNEGESNYQGLGLQKMDVTNNTDSHYAELQLEGDNHNFPPERSDK